MRSSKKIVKNLRHSKAKSDFNILEVRNFVEYEMNYAIGDPTGVKQLEWIKSALELEKRVLSDLEKEH